MTTDTARRLPSTPAGTPDLSLPPETSSLYLRAFVLLGAYFVAARFSLSLAFQHPSATPVSPPTGIAAAALVLRDFRLWPAVFAGVVLDSDAGKGSRFWIELGAAPEK